MNIGRAAAWDEFTQRHFCASTPRWIYFIDKFSENWDWCAFYAVCMCGYSIKTSSSIDDDFIAVTLWWWVPLLHNANVLDICVQTLFYCTNFVYKIIITLCDTFRLSYYYLMIISCRSSSSHSLSLFNHCSYRSHYFENQWMDDGGDARTHTE